MGNIMTVEQFIEALAYMPDMLHIHDTDGFFLVGINVHKTHVQLLGVDISQKQPVTAKALYSKLLRIDGELPVCVFYNATHPEQSIGVVKVEELADAVYLTYN